MSSTIKQDMLAGTVQTTNATPATLITIPVPTGATVQITANVCAHIAATSGGSFEIMGTYRNNAGTISLVGANVATLTNRDAGVSTATLTLVISGTNVIVTATGIA